MANRLAGKRALITAAGAGMGRAAALAFAREGAKVLATDLNSDSLQSLAGNESIETARLDVTSEREVNEFVAAAGAVDILFNCAGWVHQGSLLECRLEDWDKSFGVNVRSMFLVTKAMLPKMIAAGGGVILNMASVLGTEKAAPSPLAYAARKAAVAGFTRAPAIHHVTQGILVNSVCPGTVDTPAVGASFLDSILSPIAAMALAGGSTMTMPLSFSACANAAFSLRKP